MKLNFFPSMTCCTGLTGLVRLAVLARAGRTADALLTGSGRFLRLGLEISDNRPGQPAHKTACQQNLDGQKVPRRRQQQR